ncbi:MAG: histidine phosphatase family protein [Deltaproteobacteria bacterium]|nr:histidine phosphatase family protein [Deltaproteobacteria bacterium]MCB9786255.1 histidine phosphatase family protein [Deltaproteobacteria bacterium]
MERRLIVMRHAKSAWGTDATSDHERPLNGRGRHDAPLIGQELAELEWEPDAVWASDSTRTRETWELMSEAFADPPEVTLTRELYLGDLDAIRDVAAGWSPELHTVLVLGHNPGWEQAVGELTGRPVSMTTGNAVLLEGHGDDWTDALLGRWRIAGILRPREL